MDRDRKYRHRGYKDAENQDKEKKSTRKPEPGKPLRQEQFGPRTPRMVGTVTRGRCANCGAVLQAGFDPAGQCPRCQFELHSCKQCRFFDSGAQFECTQQITDRVSPKDAKNDCKFYDFRMTVEKDTAPTSYSQTPAAAPVNHSPSRPHDARRAFDDLFKK